MGWAPALVRVGLISVCMGRDLGLKGSARINMVVSGKNRLGSAKNSLFPGRIIAVFFLSGYLVCIVETNKISRSFWHKLRRHSVLISPFVGCPLSGVVYFNTVYFYIINRGYDCYTIHVISLKKISIFPSVIAFTVYIKKEIGGTVSPVFVVIFSDL